MIRDFAFSLSLFLFAIAALRMMKVQEETSARMYLLVTLVLGLICGGVFCFTFPTTKLSLIGVAVVWIAGLVGGVFWLQRGRPKEKDAVNWGCRVAAATGLALVIGDVVRHARLFR